MPAPRPLIAGNWKMNGRTEDGAKLAGAVRAWAQANNPRCDLLLCPPFTLVQAVAHIVLGAPVAVGGQDCHAEAAGAYTGDIAAPMLRDAGASHVILGHSERRQYHKETDAEVAAKALAARAAGLTAIICVGETEAERVEGRAEAVVGAQLAGSVPDGATAADLVVAYEPVWAIGTGRTPTEADVAAMHAFIRARLVERFGPGEGAGMRLLYGGSVKATNAQTLLAVPEVNGALVGGASLKAEEFCAIAAAVP
ncbi:MAG: triose-phosphate isomerase [Alphaproteobacteria bacterium]|nr:triose-phosphate isomerase [Alphaproteobacteria bacterium]